MAPPAAASSTPTQAPLSHGSNLSSSLPPMAPEQTLSLILRGLAVVLTFIPVVVMGTAKEDLTVTDSFTGITFTIGKVKSVNSNAFVYFIVVNVLVMVYSMASFPLLFLSRSGPKILELAVSLADMVVLVFLLTSNGAATAIILVADQGVDQYSWGKFCDKASSFCASVNAAIALSMVAAVAYVVLVSVKLFDLQKKA